MTKRILISATALLLAACSNKDPGPLEGTWRLADPAPPLTITFTRGQAESLGLIDEVTYKVDGDEVIVTWETGLTAGSSVRYTVIEPGVVRSNLGLMTKVR